MKFTSRKEHRYAMQQNKQSQVYVITMAHPGTGRKFVVHVRASDLITAERRALKRYPLAKIAESEA